MIWKGLFQYLISCVKHRENIIWVKGTNKMENTNNIKSMNDVVYMNRELSWLKFNERVLNEAGNASIPLAERCS